MTRTGKIARLPQGTRSLLNQRLLNGEEGKELVQWLNRLWIVKEVLAKHFGGRSISEQNLSEWKQGGYQDWLRHQETRALAREFLDEAEELEEEIGETPLTDRLTESVALALARLLRDAQAEEDQVKRRAAVLEIARELAELRKGDHKMERGRIERERWEIESEQREAEERKHKIREMKNRLTAPIWAAASKPIVVEAFGGGEIGEWVADFLAKVEAMNPEDLQSLHWKPSPLPSPASEPV